MRWIVSLLLLANVIVFAWYSQQDSEAVTSRDEDKGNVRLLSEVNAEDLLRRDIVTADRTVVRNELYCGVVSGLYTSAQAEQLLEAIQVFDLNALLKDQRRDEVLGYEISVSLPLVVPQIEMLQAKGFTLRQYSQQMVAQFVELNTAQVVLAQLEPELPVGVAAEMSALARKTGGFEVWVELPGGEETASKIKLIAAEMGLLLKIEKKLCKGVASARSRE